MDKKDVKVDTKSIQFIELLDDDHPYDRDNVLSYTNLLELNLSIACNRENACNRVGIDGGGQGQVPDVPRELVPSSSPPIEPQEEFENEFFVQQPEPTPIVYDPTTATWYIQQQTYTTSNTPTVDEYDEYSEDEKEEFDEQEVAQGMVIELNQGEEDGFSEDGICRDDLPCECSSCALGESGSMFYGETFMDVDNDPDYQEIDRNDFLDEPEEKIDDVGNANFFSAVDQIEKFLDNEKFFEDILGPAWRQSREPSDFCFPTKSVIRSFQMSDVEAVELFRSDRSCRLRPDCVVKVEFN